MKYMVFAQLDMETPVTKEEGLFAHSRVPKGVLLHRVVRVHGRHEAGTSLHAALLVDVEDEDHVDLILEGIEDLYDWDVLTTRHLGSDRLDPRQSDDEVFEAFVQDEEEALDDEADDEDEEDEESDDEVEEDDDE